jgi:hypothetical protein
MQDNTLLILGLVGLAVVCFGIFVFFFLTLLRLSGHRIFSFLQFVDRSAHEEQATDRSYIQNPKPNLRAIAQSNDFDAALAKHVVQDEIEPRAAKAPPPTQSANLPPSSAAQSLADEPPRLGSRRKRTFDRPQDEEDDMLADFLDEGP